MSEAWRANARSYIISEGSVGKVPGGWNCGIPSCYVCGIDGRVWHGDMFDHAKVVVVEYQGRLSIAARLEKSFSSHCDR